MEVNLIAYKCAKKKSTSFSRNDFIYTLIIW